MESKLTGEPKKYIIHQKRPNGDTYVVEREVQYCQEGRKNVVLSTHLIGKIPSGTTEMIPTRPRRKPSEIPSPVVQAERTHTGMMMILDYVGKQSGVDGALYNNTDMGTAEKIISLARYIVATGGAPFPNIGWFQQTHPLPYEAEITEDIYHNLFKDLATNASLLQSFFYELCKGLDKNASIAYDSTTIATYSEDEALARWGYPAIDEGLPVIKLLVLYSVETHLPCAFALVPGNSSDVSILSEALDQLGVEKLSKALVVMDSGFYSEPNVAEMLWRSFRFIIRTQVSISWIRTCVDQVMETLKNVGTICTSDPHLHGATTSTMHTFTIKRKYGSAKKDLKSGDTEEFSRRIWVHVYFDVHRQVEEDDRSDRELLEVKSLLEAGADPASLGAQRQDLAKHYLNVQTVDSEQIVSIRETEFAASKKYHGIFVLISNSIKNADECLRIYRKRPHIERFIELAKQDAWANRIRVWDPDLATARLFVQFVGLCYYEYLYEKIAAVKRTLTKHLAEASLNKEQLDLEKKLLCWLEKRSLEQILHWFDGIDETSITRVVDKPKKTKWQTPFTKRDRLFLEMLGMPSTFGHT